MAAKKAKTVKKKTAKKKESKKVAKPTEKITCRFIGDAVLADSSDLARDLYHKSAYGSLVEKKLQLSLLEAMFLLERGVIEILNKRGNCMEEQTFLKKAEKLEPKFFLRYAVFKDFRTRGYVIKTALKFGADFRVYERGIKPGEDHAKWVVFPVREASTLTWHEFSSKNRVAHSTKKRLLIGVVDDESCPTYYEIRWIRP